MGASSNPNFDGYFTPESPALRDDALAKSAAQESRRREFGTLHKVTSKSGETLSQRAGRLDLDAGAPKGNRRSGRTGGDAAYILPEPCVVEGTIEFPNAAAYGAPPGQLQTAGLMHRLGLESKSRRRAYCGILGRQRMCGSGHTFFVPYCCGNRYCPTCGRQSFNRLFAKYAGLGLIVKRLVPHWPVYGHVPSAVIAKLDFTQKNSGEMPTPDEVKRFNRNIRKFFRAVERWLGISRKDYGVLWCNEFGGLQTRNGKIGNTNLHAHAVYCGPFLPQKNKELSKLWADITGDGSFIVSIQAAKSFYAALYHALKYAGKVLSTDPHRLAELESTFHGVRRVHTLAAFYNPKDIEKQLPQSPPCPSCGERLFDASGPWLPIQELRKRGIRELEEARSEIGRERVLTGSRWGAPF